jgi:aspartate/methionine/tyrosine aminotransferase
MAAMVEEFRARRDLVVDGLNAIPGIRCLSPKGAFYAFPEISGTGLGGKELADRLLLEAGVCVLAGTAFGGVATNHIRVSYANSRENLTTALGRIGAFVSSLPAGAAAVAEAAASSGAAR